MALTEDREYGCMNPDEFVEILAGTADTLYKGGIMSIAAADGFIKVADVTAADVALGLAKKQVVAAGSHAEKVAIDTGRLAVEKKTCEKATWAPGTGGTLNVNYDGVYFILYSGTTKYCCWFDTGSSVNPTTATPSLGISVPIVIGTADNAATVGGKVSTAVNAIGGAGVVFASTGTTTVIVTAVHRGANTAFAAGTALTVFPMTWVASGNAIQDDNGLLKYAIADDGVVDVGQKSTATVAFGLCIGLVGHDNQLWIDTRIRKI